MKEKQSIMYSYSVHMTILTLETLIPPLETD